MVYVKCEYLFQTYTYIFWNVIKIKAIIFINRWDID